MTLPLYQNRNITNISNHSNDLNDSNLQIEKDIKEIKPITTTIETNDITNQSSPIKITSSLQDSNIPLNECTKSSYICSSSSSSSSSTENQNANISYGNQSTISFNTRFKFMEKFKKSNENIKKLNEKFKKSNENLTNSKEAKEKNYNINKNYNELYNICENNLQYSNKNKIQDQDDFYKNYPRLFEFNNEDELYDLFNQFPTFKYELNQEIDRFEKKYNLIDSNVDADADADKNDDNDLPDFGTINISDIKDENLNDNNVTTAIVLENENESRVKSKIEEKEEEEDSNSSTEIVTDLSLTNQYSEDELTTTQPATNRISDTSKFKDKLVKYSEEATTATTAATAAAADNTIIDKSFGTSPIYSLYVGDLDKSINEEELKKYFGKFKGFSSLKIPRDSNTGISLGYAYINYQNEQLAKFVLEELNYRQIGNKEIRIMPSIRDRKSRELIGENIFISNLPKKLTLREIYEIFRKFGEILSCKLNSDKNFAFVHFKDKKIANQVILYYKKNLFKDEEIFITIHVSKKNREICKNDKKFKNIVDNNNDNTKNNESFLDGIFDDTIKSFKILESPVKSGTVSPTKSDGGKNFEMSYKEKEEFKNKLLATINSSIVTNESSTILSDDFLEKGTSTIDNCFVKSANQRDFEEEDNNDSDNNNLKDKEYEMNSSDDSFSWKVSSEHSIFVRNLPINITKLQIKSIIEPFGNITSILVRQNMMMKASWSLVTLNDEQSVLNCINGLNGIKINNKILSVTKAIPREEKAYFNKNISKMPTNIFGYSIILNNLNFEKNKVEFEKNYFKLKTIKYINFYDTLKLTVLKNVKEFKQVSESFPKISIETNDKNFKDFKIETNKERKKLVYGYIELTSLNERDYFIKFLKKIGCKCYKINIENNNLKKMMRHHLIKQSNNGNFKINNDYYKLKKRLDEFNREFKMDLIQLKNNKSKSGIIGFNGINNKLNQKSIKNEEEDNKIEFKQLKNLNFGKENNDNENESNDFEEIKEQVDKILLILINKIFNINKNLNKNLNEIKINSIINNLIKFYWSNNYFNLFSNLQKNYSITIIKLLNNIIDTSYYLGILSKDIKIKKINYDICINDTQ
ncbi:unnamed protein product [[Candida] boidinii]|uniref:Unnamed protein product n=1 Tax=Candida boidinii TaxID=5477 RepID=A0ACB5TP80_CANBO|nr:unnamed protein product [[Candida] boidinii]